MRTSGYAGNMIWRLDTLSPATYADQIAAQVRGGISRGELQPGEKLPTGRELAQILEINLHTVLRAYQQLRDEGLIELRRGKGAIIADSASVNPIQAHHAAAVLVAEAKRLGWSLEEALESLRSGWNGERENKAAKE